MRWMCLCAVVYMLLAPSTATGQTQKLTASFEAKARQIRVTATGDPGECWRKSGDNTYTLKATTEGCLERIELDDAKDVRIASDGVYSIEGKPTQVECVFKGAACMESAATAHLEQGPFVVVLANGSLRRVADISGPTVTPSAAAANRTIASCTWTEENGEESDVAIDLVTKSVVRAPSRNVVSPNQGLVVHVCRDPTKNVTVVWGGTRGMTRATTDFELRAAGAEREPDTVTPPISTYRFPPRTAGAADLKVFEGTDTSGTPAMEVQLEVEPRYWGAVRFGLGTLFGPWRSYEIATFSGSRQQEVRENDSGAAFELVTGLAPYVLDLGSGGRSHTGGPNKRVAPYIGFGVIGTSGHQGIEALSSFHGGLEFEVASNFSIAATFVYRRTNALAAGYDPGSPVAVGMNVDDVTTDDWRPGMALVVNATPKFLEFATGKASSDGGGQ